MIFSSCKTQYPETFGFDPQNLSYVKEEISKGNSSYEPALNKLITQAEKALSEGTFSVTEKTFVPPSGDVHDYRSLAIYWWPDSTKEDFLPYIRKDGQVNPEITSKRFDQNSRVKFIQNIQTLALAYFFTGQDRYASHAGKLARTWFVNPETRMNPNLNFSQAVPGLEEGRCFGIIEFSRIGYVLDAISLIKHSPCWESKDQSALEQWLGEYLNWLQTSKLGVKEGNTLNNHATWYDVQVAHIALFLGKDSFARDVINNVKNKRIATQIDSLGRMEQELLRTRSFSYTIMNCNAFLVLAGLGEYVDVDLMAYESPEGGSIVGCIDFWAPYTDSSKKWPFQQITPAFNEKGMTTIVENLRRAYYYTNNKTYKNYISLLPEDSIKTNRVNLLFPDK